MKKNKKCNVWKEKSHLSMRPKTQTYYSKVKGGIYDTNHVSSELLGGRVGKQC